MAHIAERLDIEACEENLDHYARAGDARSWRDIGLALARELTATRERADLLGDLAKWLVSLDEVAPGPEEYAPTMEEVIIRAREALGRTEEG